MRGISTFPDSLCVSMLVEFTIITLRVATMKTVQHSALTFLILFIGTYIGSANELPMQLRSSACSVPPTIDGIINESEWQHASSYSFEIEMIAPGSSEIEKRMCKLHVMNSANGVYVAFSIPDKTVNRTLAPIDTDFAMLAFCRGKKLAAGDDRKAIIPGHYVDKYLIEAGKDSDDEKQDGQGGHDPRCGRLLGRMGYSTRFR